MSLNSILTLGLIQNLPYLIAGISFLCVALLLLDSLRLRFDFKTSLKCVGFGVLGSFSIINFISGSYIQTTVWAFLLGLFLILVGFTLEFHSKLRLLLPLPFVLAILIKGHILLVIISVLIAIVIFQIAYSTKHKDLVPLGISFILIGVGEYFYYLGLRELYPAGSFLYLATAVVLLFWLSSYLSLRLGKKLRRD